METTFSFTRTDAVEVNLFCNESHSRASGQFLSRSLLLCVFVGLLSVLITCGNLLVITSIMYFKQLHTPTNYLILSLAVADLLVGLIVLPFSTVLSVSSCWYLTGFLCTIRGMFDILLCGTSILNLCFISVDRYCAVCQPLTYTTKMTVRVTTILITVSWTVPALAFAILTPGLKQSNDNVKCALFQSSKTVIIGSAVTSYIPAILILSVYMKILTVALKQARSIQTTRKSGPCVNKMDNKATKTLAIVVGIYLMCWSPFFISVAFYPLTRNIMPVAVIEAFKWLGWSNSMINPFVYGFFYKWYRSAFKIMISGKIFQGDFSDAQLS